MRHEGFQHLDKRLRRVVGVSQHSPLRQRGSDTNARESGFPIDATADRR